MNQAHIVVFGLRIAAAPRTVKLFMLTWLPLLMLVGLFNGYLVADAVAARTGLPFVLVVVLLFVVTFKLTYNRPDGTKGALALLPWSWARSTFSVLLLAHGLLFYAQAQELLYVGSLAAFAVLMLVSRLGAFVQRRRDRAQAQAQAQAEVLNPRTVTDIPFREVSR